MRRGARGRSRTGMGLPPRDFLTRYGFRRYARSERIWSLDFTFAMSLLFSALSDFRQGPSSLYTFIEPARTRCEHAWTEA